MSNTYPIYQVAGRLVVEVHQDRAELGKAAARSVAAYLREVIQTQGEARVVFGCAPSQDEMLEALLNPVICGVALDWSKVLVFHMDDYVGLTAKQPESFRSYLYQHLLQRVKVREFYPIPGETADPAAACVWYASLLSQRPIDLICMGIGENGHIAFNDPPVADFEDPALVKVVEIDLACRQQQVNDGCFLELDAVPKLAFTLTVPVFRHARRLSVHVPGERKAAAVRAALMEPITTKCPASILRVHPQATLYLDRDSAAQL